MKWFYGLHSIIQEILCKIRNCWYKNMADQLYFSFQVIHAKHFTTENLILKIPHYHNRFTYVLYIYIYIYIYTTFNNYFILRMFLMTIYHYFGLLSVVMKRDQKQRSTSISFWSFHRKLLSWKLSISNIWCQILILILPSCLWKTSTQLR